MITDDETEYLVKVLKSSAIIICRFNFNIKHTRAHFAEELSRSISLCANLSLPFLRYVGTPECIRTFFSSTLVCPNVKLWSLAFTELDSHSIQALGTSLQRKPLSGRIFFKLTHSDIKREDMVFLVDGIPNGNRQHFTLQCNSIKSGGMAYLAATLNNAIVLDLPSNNIGPDGTTAFASGLRNLNRLQLLVLSHNNIGPEGAAALAGKLQYLTELRSCDVSYNNIDLAGAKALLASVEKCQYLQCLIINIETGHYSIESNGVILEGLVSPDEPDDSAVISGLVEAAGHVYKRTLKFGFRTIEVLPRSSSLDQDQLALLLEALRHKYR